MSDKEYITILVHGESKVGKTTLAATSPKPIIVLDAEGGGMRFVPGKKTTWDPTSGEPEKGFDIYRVDVTRLDHIEAVHNYLLTNKFGFKALVFDSLTEMQARIKREINSDGMLDQQGWGRILSKFEDLVWQARDLAAAPGNALIVVMFIAGTGMKDGMFRPLMQGQVVNQLPYKVDICGYLLMQADANNNLRRGLRVRNSTTEVVGERVGSHVPNVVWDPDVSSMFKTIFNEGAN